MKVNVEIKRWKEDFVLGIGGYALARTGDIQSVRLERIDPCCPSMKTAWDDGFVVLGEDKKPEVCIVKTYCYPEGAVTDFMTIWRCPFCGDGINIIATEYQ